MSDGVLTESAAVSIVRRLSGTANYPFHHEGEVRMAEVLMQYTDGVGHARAVIEEFDGETCPSVEQIRTEAARLKEQCRCGVPRWSHLDSGCGKFAAAVLDEEVLRPLSREEAKRRWSETISEAEQIMENARLYELEEKSRNILMLKKLGPLWTYKSDLIRAQAWRDLGFILKRWMRDSLRAAGQNLESPTGVINESIEARERARRVLTA